MVRKLGNVKQIVCYARHYRADLCVVVIREGKLLQMREHIPAHIGFNTRSHYVTDGRHIIVCRRVYNPQHKVKRTDLNDKAYRQRSRGGNGSVGYFSYYHRQH